MTQLAPIDPAAPLCWYCGSTPMRATGAELFPDRSDLAIRHYLHCRNCDAWVGCHPRTWNPYGHLANERLRRLRIEAHDRFDAMWRDAAAASRWTEQVAKSAAHSWLAQRTKGSGHIAGMGPDECIALTAACALKPNLAFHVRRVLQRGRPRKPAR